MRRWYNGHVGVASSWPPAAVVLTCQGDMRNNFGASSSGYLVIGKKGGEVRAKKEKLLEGSVLEAPS